MNNENMRNMYKRTRDDLIKHAQKNNVHKHDILKLQNSKEDGALVIYLTGKSSRKEVAIKLPLSICTSSGAYICSHNQDCDTNEYPRGIIQYLTVERGNDYYKIKFNSMNGEALGLLVANNIQNVFNLIQEQSPAFYQKYSNTLYIHQRVLEEKFPFNLDQRPYKKTNCTVQKTSDFFIPESLKAKLRHSPWMSIYRPIGIDSVFMVNSNQAQNSLEKQPPKIAPQKKSIKQEKKQKEKPKITSVEKVKKLDELLPENTLKCIREKAYEFAKKEEWEFHIEVQDLGINKNFPNNILQYITQNIDKKMKEGFQAVLSKPQEEELLIKHIKKYLYSALVRDSQSVNKKKAKDKELLNLEELNTVQEFVFDQDLDDINDELDENELDLDDSSIISHITDDDGMKLEKRFKTDDQKKSLATFLRSRLMPYAFLNKVKDHAQKYVNEHEWSADKVNSLTASSINQAEIIRYVTTQLGTCDGAEDLSAALKRPLLFSFLKKNIIPHQKIIRHDPAINANQAAIFNEKHRRVGNIAMEVEKEVNNDGVDNKTEDKPTVEGVADGDDGWLNISINQ